MADSEGIKVDESQTVKIKLSEFLKLKEVYDHRKEVKIEERFITKGSDSEYEGTNLTWRSDGKCWRYLTSKLSSYTDKYGNLYKKYEDLKNMSVKDFKKFKKKLNEEQ